MKRISSIIISILLVLNTLAQSEGPKSRELFRKADSYLYHKQYRESLTYLLQLHKINPKNARYLFMISECYLALEGETLKAEKYLEDYIKYVEKEEIYFDAYFFLGKVYHLDYHFNEAITSLEKFLELSAPFNSNRKEAARLIEICHNAKQHIANKIDYKIENIGASINSAYPDYVPLISADESVLIFTSRRPGSTGGLQNIAGIRDTIKGKYFEDIYISTKIVNRWTTPVGIGSQINTAGHDATVGLSPDGQKLFVYRSDGLKSGNIFSCELEGDAWKEPKILDNAISTKYWEGSASISADERTLYFSSERPGGYGGRDIYMIKKLPNGQWAEPRNLGEKINTEFDDDAPFIHPDGKTLYFSSKGHNTMGEYDLFKTVNIGAYKWSEPINLGYPINTTAEDIYFVLSASGKHGYYSSVKPNGFGEKDIYVIQMPEEEWLTPQPLTLLKGVVKSEEFDSLPPNTKIEVHDNATGELVGIYKANPVTGKYLVIVPSGKDYNIAIEADGHLFHSENISVGLDQTDYVEISKNIVLPSKKAGRKITLNNVFYEFGKANLTDASMLEMDRIFKLLKKDSSLIIEISGHTDSKGNFDFNVHLSTLRAKNVVKYLLAKGIAKDRLVSVGYGMVRPTALNVNIDGSDNPEGRKLNRRTEMKVLSVGGKKADYQFKKPENKILIRELEAAKLREELFFKVKIAEGNYIDKNYFWGFENIVKRKNDKGIYEYLAGLFYDYKSANKYKSDLIKMGIPDANIFAFEEGKQIEIPKQLDVVK